MTSWNQFVLIDMVIFFTFVILGIFWLKNPIKFLFVKIMNVLKLYIVMFCYQIFEFYCSCKSLWGILNVFDSIMN